MSKIGQLRELLIALLQEHKRDGALPTSARFLFYELVQRGHISKERQGARRPDQDMSDALTDIREDGLVPWDWIVDEARSLDDFTGYPSVTDGVQAQLPYVRLDPWDDQAPMILTESRSLAGVLRPIARDYRVRIASTNGQCGGFLHTGIAPYLSPGDRVLYFGDLDLAGDQIEANTQRVLEQQIGGPLQWERIALTEQQARGLPKIIKHDRRFKDGRPHEAVETEALSQKRLTAILRRRLDRIIPEPLAAVHKREDRERAAIERRIRGRR
jgi:hypothetical protein